MTSARILAEFFCKKSYEFSSDASHDFKLMVGKYSFHSQGDGWCASAAIATQNSSIAVCCRWDL